MDTRYTVGVNEYKRMSTAELRDAFMVDLFEEGRLNLLYCEVEGSVVGAAGADECKSRPRSGQSVSS